MLYIATNSYNSAHTLKRAVDSVLEQTYTDFCYYLCDNGSTDDGKTRQIVEEYAKHDSRVVPFYNKKNHVWDGNEKCRNLTHNIGDNDYFCQLDADDEYLPTFVEKMFEFINAYDFDIAACGSDFINAQTNVLLSRREIQQNLVLEGTEFGTFFTVYHQFMRTIWGKLFKGRTLREFVRDASNNPNFPRAYGGDTYNTLISFRSAKRVGILAGTLHKYYMSPKSASYKWIPGRVETDRILDNVARAFLLDKCGTISPQNEQFLHLVYFNAIKDTLDVLLTAKLSSTEKIQHINDIFTYETTKELFSRDYATDYESTRKLRVPVLNWLLAQKESRRPDGAKAAAEVITTMYADLPQTFNQEGLSFIISKMPEMVAYLLKKDYGWVFERLNRWNKNHDADEPALTEFEFAVYRALNKPDDEVFTLLADIRKKRPKSSRKLNTDTRIGDIFAKYPLLKNVSAKLGAVIPYTVCSIIKENFPQALDQFLSVTQGMEIADGDIEAYLTLAQNLSAVAGHTDAYVHFKKIWVSYLLDSSRNEEARRELDEMAQLLPGDENLSTLRKKLIS